jgi:hypothetical protein
MTERSLGSNFKWFVAKVVNRGDGNQGKKDNTESGRVQIRIYGKHDDEKNMPDDKLPWAVPLLPLGTGASSSGVGATPVGLKKGSTVVGFYADRDETIPIIFGIMHKAGTDAGEDGTELETKNNDIPKGARSKDTQGKDQNDVLNKALTEEVGKEGQLHLDKKTIGNIPFDGGGVLDAIKSADPSNLSGSIQGALNNAKSMVNTLSVAGSLLANMKGLLSGALPIGNLMGIAGAAAGIASGGLGGLAGLTGGMAGGLTGGLGGAVGSLSGAIGQASALAGGVSAIAGGLSGAAAGLGQIAGAEGLITGARLGVSSAVGIAPAISVVTNVGGLAISATVTGNRTVAQAAGIVVGITNNLDSIGNIVSASASLTSSGIAIASGPIATVATAAGNLSSTAGAVMGAATSISTAASMAASAFNGGNPLQSILGGLGGIAGLAGMASKFSGLLGPLTGNFAAASAIAGNLKSNAQMVFAGVQAAPIPKLPGVPNLGGMLGNIGNIAGIVNNIAGNAAGIFGGNSPLGGLAGGLGNIANIAGAVNIASNIINNPVSSLMNSAIQLPSSSLNGLNQMSRLNPGVNISLNPNYITDTVRQIGTGISNFGAPVGVIQSGYGVGTFTGGRIIPSYQRVSPNIGITSLQNTIVSVRVPTILTTPAIGVTIGLNSGGVNFSVIGTAYTSR